jgi:hypothetical protein
MLEGPVIESESVEPALSCCCVLTAHPAVLVPVTENVVVTDGDVTIEFVVLPSLHMYVEAPEAISVAVSPAHIPEGPLMVTVGLGDPFIVMVCVADPGHGALVPIIEYVVLTDGVTTSIEPVAFVFQVYVFEPDAVIVAGVFPQTSVLVVARFTLGGVDTDIDDCPVD